MTRDEAIALLPEYVLDALTDEERAGVDGWLADPEAGADLKAELRSVAEGLADFGEGAAPPAGSLDPRLKARLVASAAGVDRYSAVFDDIGRVCDITIDAVRRVLAQVDDAAAWLAGPMPGILIQHFDHGPAAQGADTGFVRYPPNFAFPRHRHQGRETTIVLDGGFTDHDGRFYGPGDVLVYEDATEHHFTVGPEGLTMVICFTGYEPL